MSLWSTVRRFFGKSAGYVLVWREHSSAGAVMKGELIAGRSDADAISLVRAKFMHVEPHWSFYALFRANDTLVTAERGPKIAKWLGDFAHVGSDSHVVSTLQSVRRHGASVVRPLHKIKLKSSSSAPQTEEG